MFPELSTEFNEMNGRMIFLFYSVSFVGMGFIDIFIWLKSSYFSGLIVLPLYSSLPRADQVCDILCVTQKY
jgi:hypothetical protein